MTGYPHINLVNEKLLIEFPCHRAWRSHHSVSFNTCFSYENTTNNCLNNSWINHNLYHFSVPPITVHTKNNDDRIASIWHFTILFRWAGSVLKFPTHFSILFDRCTQLKYGRRSHCHAHLCFNEPLPAHILQPRWLNSLKHHFSRSKRNWSTRLDALPKDWAQKLSLLSWPREWSLLRNAGYVTLYTLSVCLLWIRLQGKPLIPQQ